MTMVFRHVALFGKYHAAVSAAQVAGTRAALEDIANFLARQGCEVVVERETAGRRERSEFDRSRVHVEPKACDRSLIMVSAQGRSVEVGRYVRPELRQALASEIRMALRTA